MLPGMGSARDSSDMDTAAAAGARARVFDERGDGLLEGSEGRHPFEGTLRSESRLCVPIVTSSLCARRRLEGSEGRHPGAAPLQRPSSGAERRKAPYVQERRSSETLSLASFQPRS